MRRPITSVVTGATALALTLGAVVGAGPAGAAPAVNPPGPSVRLPAYSNHVAVQPGGRYAYVSSANKNVVTVVDLRTGRKVRTLRVGRGPVSIGFNRAGTRAYTVNSLGGTVTVINTARRRTIRTVRVGAISDGIENVAVTTTKGKDKLFVTASAGTWLDTYNFANRRQGRIRVQQNPYSIVRAGNRLVVASASTGAVRMLNPTTGKITRSLTTPAQSAVIFADVYGTRVVLTGFGYTSWLNTTTGRFARRPLRVANPGNLTAVHFADRGRYTLITTSDFPDVPVPSAGTLTVVSNRTHRVVRTMPVGLFPWSFGVGTSTVAVPTGPISGATSTTLHLIPLRRVIG
jgi:YVTN family beta-propeller protein